MRAQDHCGGVSAALALLKSSCLAALTAFVLHDNCSAVDWPHYRGPSGNGISQEAVAISEGRQLGTVWKAKVGVGTSSCVLGAGRLYTMGHLDSSDWVHCFDAVTGIVIWSYHHQVSLDPNLFEGGTRSTPTLDGNRLFTLSHEGHVVCLDAVTGNVLWQRHFVKDFGGR